MKSVNLEIWERVKGRLYHPLKEEVGRFVSEKIWLAFTRTHLVGNYYHPTGVWGDVGAGIFGDIGKSFITGKIEDSVCVGIEEQKEELKHQERREEFLKMYFRDERIKQERRDRLGITGEVIVQKCASPKVVQEFRIENNEIKMVWVRND